MKSSSPLQKGGQGGEGTRRMFVYPGRGAHPPPGHPPPRDALRSEVRERRCPDAPRSAWGRRGRFGSSRPRTHHARKAATWPRREPASATPQPLAAPGRSLFSLSRCRAASCWSPRGARRYSWCPSPAAFPAPSEPPGFSRS